MLSLLPLALFSTCTHCHTVVKPGRFAVVWNCSSDSEACCLPRNSLGWTLRFCSSSFKQGKQVVSVYYAKQEWAKDGKEKTCLIMLGFEILLDPTVAEYSSLDSQTKKCLKKNLLVSKHAPPSCHIHGKGFRYIWSSFNVELQVFHSFLYLFPVVLLGISRSTTNSARHQWHSTLDPHDPQWTWRSGSSWH